MLKFCLTEWTYRNLTTTHKISSELLKGPASIALPSEGDVY